MKKSDIFAIVDRLEKILKTLEDEKIKIIYGTTYWHGEVIPAELDKKIGGYLTEFYIKAIIDDVKALIPSPKTL